MLWSKFSDLFHPSWHQKIKPFVESEEMDKIYAFLKSESRRGIKILPDSINVFRAFQIPLDKINVVLLGYSPYHNLVNDIPCADGLAFSNSLVSKISPSLVQFYKGIENDVYGGLNLSYQQEKDLSYLLDEGIFLWNSSLTVAYMKPGSHQSVWLPFTKYVIEKCLAYTGIPIVLIGKDAQFYERYMTPLTHGYIFKCEHMAFAARENRDWNTNGIFKQITKLVELENGYKIKWLKEYEN